MSIPWAMAASFGSHLTWRLPLSTRFPLVLFIAACSSHPGTTPETPDAPVIADAAPDAPACVANTTACVGDAIVMCGADGTPLTSTQCDLGCDASGATPVCNVLEPSNLAATTC